MAKRTASTGSGSTPPGDPISPAVDAAMRIVLIESKDALIRSETTRRLREALEREHGEIEQFVFNGAECDPASVLDELRSFGLMTPHKLVIVDQAEKLLRGPKTADPDDPDGAADEDEAAQSPARPMFERYADQPAGTATLLLRAETLPKGKLDQKIAAVGAVYRLKEPNDAEAAGWLIARAREAHGATLDRKAAALLVSRLGVDLLRLDSEVGRLAAMVGGEGGAITAVLIDEQVQPSREEKIWTLQGEFLSGDAGRAVGALRYALDVSREPEELVSWALVDLCRKIHAVSLGSQRGDNPRDLAGALRLWGDSASRVLALGRALQPGEARGLLERAIASDRALKQGGDKRLALELVALALGEASSRA